MNRNRMSRWAATVLLAASAMAGAAEGKIERGDRVAVCGDSITEQKQYSVFIEDYLLMCQPAEGLSAIQVGWSGERAPGFLARMKADALWYKPNVVTTLYGMNDGEYTTYKEEIGKKYRDAMTDVVKTFKEGGVRLIVVGSPGLVDPATFPPGYLGKRFSDLPAADYAKVYNENLGKLTEIAKEVAKEQGVVYADVHETMQAAMEKAKAKYGEKYHVAGPDGIHPAANGHIVMAYAFLKAMGCDGNIGTITVDMKAGTAEGSEGHKVLSDDNGVVQVESSKYPFCFYGDPKDPAATSGIIEFVPFNQDLNRFDLVVKNGPEKVKVTWGTETKEFTREQAEKGINLAAEFLDNPFSEKFKEVEDAIRLQQKFETPMIKSVLNMKADYNTGGEDGLKALKEGVEGEDETLFAKARGLVTPVKYEIKVEGE